MPSDYEFSQAYVETFVLGIKRSGQLDAVLDKASVEAKALVKDPYSETWQPAKLVEELGEVTASILGEPVLNDITYRALRARFGPIVLPMISSTLKANKTPGTILKKLNSLLSVALQGVEAKWLPAGETGGSLTIHYPRPVATHVMKSWEGVLRFVFEETCPGTVKVSRALGDGSTLEYLVEWQAPAAA